MHTVLTHVLRARINLRTHKNIVWSLNGITRIVQSTILDKNNCLLRDEVWNQFCHELKTI